MPPKGHAVLSASSSERWLRCPPSARLCESYEDKGSDYAAEGTDAHELCEYKLRKALGMEVQPDMQDRELAVIDEVATREGEYVDIGKSYFGGEIVPLTVKSLAFPS